MAAEHAAMATRSLDEQAIFEVARKIDPGEARESYLLQVCGDDAAIKRRVQALLKAYQESANFLESPAASLVAALDEPMRERPGTVIGLYKLLQQIGEGGFGVVFMAEQQPLRRRVALKVLKPGVDSKQVLARFEQERQALALMDHPNIAKAIDAGTTETGRPYFVMEFVDGVPITQFCDEHQLTTRKRVELFVDVCQAVQHAHYKGVIHRDIKPSNVLVMLHDGKLVPKVIDFGIAKATAQKLTEQTLFTEVGQIVGTLEYMSPEQASFSGLDVDTRSDVYGLGVLLYELLTGTVPFEKERLRHVAYDEIVRILREEEAPKPSTRISTLGQEAPTVAAKRKVDPKRLCRLIRGELDWIVLKALEKDRNRRYDSAAKLAEDLKRWLAEEPIQARPVTRLARVGRWCRRNPWLAGVGAVAALALVALASVSLGFALYKADVADRLLGQQEEINAARLRAEQLAAGLALDKALAVCEQGDIGHGLLLLAQSLELAPEDESDLQWVSRANLAHWRKRLCTLRAFLEHKGPVMSVDFSPDGRTALTGSEDGTVRFWDTRTGQPRGPHLELGQGVRIAKFSPDGNTVLTISGPQDYSERFKNGGYTNPFYRRQASGTAQFWDVRTARPLRAPLTHWGMILCADISPDGCFVLTGHADGTARLWDMQSGQPKGEPLRTGGEVWSVAISADGQTLFTGGLNTKACFWSVSATELVTTCLKNPDSAMVFTGTFHPNGRSFLTGDASNHARRWDVATGQMLPASVRHDSTIVAVAFSPDGRSILTGSYDKTARLWDAATGRPVAQPLRHQELVQTVAWSPDGQAALTGGADKVARLWDVVPKPVREWSPGLEGEINHLALSSNGQIILTASDKVARIWNVETGQPLGPVIPQPSNGALLSPDGGTVLTWALDNRAVQLWDAHTGQALGPPLTERIYAAAFSPDGRMFATGGVEGAQLRDSTTCQPIGQTMRHPNLNVLGVAFSPDGRLLLTLTDHTLERWDVTTGSPAGPPLQHMGNVNAIGFRPDGQTYLVIENGDTVRVRETATGKLLDPTFQQLSGMNNLVLGPDGRTVLKIIDGKAQLWDMMTGKPLGALLPHYGSINAQAISANGRRLATLVTQQGTVAFSEIPEPVQGTARRIILWTQILTGMELDSHGVVRVLDSKTWQERRLQLEALGGPPDVAR
jgi:WD40 repeat protein/serine/threonine protein kinase